MGSKLIFVAIGVITTAIGLSEAIICYQCSNEDSKCQDPFNPANVGKCNYSGAESCFKTRTSNSSVTVASRGCSSYKPENDNCGETKIPGYTQISCLCKTDYCNDGQTVEPTKYNVIIGAAMVTFMSIVWRNLI